MLKEYSVSNYRSINKEITFSMEADVERVSEYKDHIIEKGNVSLLKVGSIYGPNGGGKSNLIFALNLAKIVTFFNGVQSQLMPQRVSCEFNNDDIIKETLFFLTDNYEIGYSFEVKQKIIEKEVPIPGNILYNYSDTYEFENECVSYRKLDDDDFKMLFERNKEGKVESGILENYHIIIQDLASSNSALSYLFNTYTAGKKYDNNLAVINELCAEINNIYNLNPPKQVNLKTAFEIIRKHREKLIKLLNDVDIKINDIILNVSDKIDRIKFERVVMIDGKEDKRALPFSVESSGTQKIFWMLVNVLSVFDKGAIFYCDDMNAYLHPKLYKAIIELFTSKENKKNQLIFNSHDILNMNNKLFRRDEIWFAYRDDTYSTCLVPLSNIVNYKGEQVRKDATYYKQYLEGKYGADPFIKKGLSWDD